MIFCHACMEQPLDHFFFFCSQEKDLIRTIISFLLIPEHSCCPFAMNPHRARKPVDEFDDTPIKYPSKLPPNNDGKTPNVLIVGAGLAGLLLAILLDKAGIPYEIFERSSSVKPLGTTENLGFFFRCVLIFLQKRGPQTALFLRTNFRVYHVAECKHPCGHRSNRSPGRAEGNFVSCR